MVLAHKRHAEQQNRGPSKNIPTNFYKDAIFVDVDVYTYIQLIYTFIHMYIYKTYIGNDLRRGWGYKKNGNGREVEMDSGLIYKILK